VLTPKGLSIQGTDQDDVVVMPYTSAMKRVAGGTTLRNINVQVATADRSRTGAAANNILVTPATQHQGRSR
jgi:hypothetical protein